MDTIWPITIRGHRPPDAAVAAIRDILSKESDQSLPGVTDFLQRFSVEIRPLDGQPVLKVRGPETGREREIIEQHLAPALTAHGIELKNE